MNEFYKEQTTKFQKGAKKLFDRRQEWSDFEKRALILIQSFIDEAAENGYYELLYVITDKHKPNVVSTNQSFIQFYAGSHPTGISTTVTDRVNDRISLSGVTEDSGCLSIIQEPKGGVFFIAFPSKSEVTTWDDNFIVIKYFKSPNKIMYYDLRKAIEFYLRFALYTSIYSNQTLSEKIELWWLKLKFTSVINSIFRGATFGMRLLTMAKTGVPIGPH